MALFPSLEDVSVDRAWLIALVGATSWLLSHLSTRISRQADFMSWRSSSLDMLHDCLLRSHYQKSGGRGVLLDNHVRIATALYQEWTDNHILDQVLRHFWPAEGGGGYILKPPAAGFLYPPLLYPPALLGGYFQGWGMGVYKIWPCKKGSPSDFRRVSF